MAYPIQTDINSTLDMMLAYYAAPTLFGIKPASLFWCVNSDRVNNQIDCFNNSAAHKELVIMRINGRKKHTGLLMFHRILLDQHLKDKKRIAFLNQFGYNHMLTLDGKLEILKTRMEISGEFPHEIGIFLGYPIKDVEGFIENRGQKYLLHGSWIVYSNSEHARSIFSLHRLCRDMLVNKVLNGTSIFQILQIEAAQQQIEAAQQQ